MMLLSGDLFGSWPFIIPSLQVIGILTNETIARVTHQGKAFLKRSPEAILLLKRRCYWAITCIEGQPANASPYRACLSRLT